MSDVEVISTAQAAQMLGCNQELIRSKKSRNKDKFQEGVHFLKGDGNATLWTQSGLELLRQLIGNDAVTNDGNEAVTSDSNDTVTNNGNDTVTELLVNGLVTQMADDLATEVFRRLPGALLAAVTRINRNPASSQGREAIASIKALKQPEAVLCLTGMPAV